MQQVLYVLTGASRGLGRAIAAQLLSRGAHITLLTIARKPDVSLGVLANASQAQLHQWSSDLAAPQAVAVQLGHWLRQQFECSQSSNTPLAEVVLINNAGVIPDIAPLSDSDLPQISSALMVGLTAPMLLTAAFLNATANWQISKKILNISSGLGRRAMASQATYCAAKAGMDHFSRCVALEEALKPFGARICSLAPGVIDTDMQRQLRSTAPSIFPDVQRFQDLALEGQLSSANAAAAQVLAWLDRADFGQTVIADVRQSG